MNGEVVYLSWETPVPGVSHVADDPPNSAHQHPNKETKKREYGRQSGRVVTFPPIKPGTNKDPGTKYHPLSSKLTQLLHHKLMRGYVFTLTICPANLLHRPQQPSHRKQHLRGKKKTRPGGNRQDRENMTIRKQWSVT